MNRLPALAAIAVASLLAACGGPSTPAEPVPAPTEVAAVRTPPPEYPPLLACQGIGGTSVLKVVIGPAGTPTDISVLTSSGNAALDASAQERVREWQFKPATRAGQPVPATIQVPVTFNPPQPKPNECFAIEEQARRGG